MKEIIYLPRAIGRLLRKLVSPLGFHKNGRPRRWLRRLLFHSNGRVRGVFRKWVFKTNGEPRREFVRWLAQPADPRLSQIVMVLNMTEGARIFYTRLTQSRKTTA